MDIKNPEYILIDGHPFLRMDIDEKEALLGDFKRSILEIGYVPLQSRNPEVDWAKILPPLDLPKTEEHESLPLHGFTDNSTIIKLAYKYWDAINYLNGERFKEGPVTFFESLN